MNAAITSVYSVIAVWIPVMVVSRSLATVAIDTFITELSSIMRNCPAHRVRSTNPAALALRSVMHHHQLPRASARPYLDRVD